jgi:hypothetical protein
MMMAGPETSMYVAPIAGTKETLVFEFDEDHTRVPVPAHKCKSTRAPTASQA